jgi:2-methylisocitrate lyase-like PEP mutase family enzyme
MTDEQVTMDTVAAAERAASFLAMHRPGEPLLLPNPWDAGSARVLASLGFTALATTSSGFAATFGRPDGNVNRDEALANAADIVAATGLPVSADLENGYADDPAGVAETARLAAATGLAGLSIEDYTGDPSAPFYDIAQAADRISAASEAIRSGPVPLVLTARAENLLRGNPDLGDTIARLQRYREAGADVLYAPGLSRPEDIRAVVTSVGAPVNMLAWPGGPNVAELAELGVARISVGGAFAYVAIDALATAARELREAGTMGYWTQAAAGRDVAATAFR